MKRKLITSVIVFLFGLFSISAFASASSTLNNLFGARQVSAAPPSSCPVSAKNFCTCFSSNVIPRCKYVKAYYHLRVGVCDTVSHIMAEEQQQYGSQWVHRGCLAWCGTPDGGKEANCQSVCESSTKAFYNQTSGNHYNCPSSL